MTYFLSSSKGEKVLVLITTTGTTEIRITTMKFNKDILLNITITYNILTLKEIPPPTNNTILIQNVLNRRR